MDQIAICRTDVVFSLPLKHGQVSLSCTGKKVTKENGIGEALTAKPIGAAFITPPFSPASSRPPLCTPSGAGRQTCCRRYLFGQMDISSSVSVLKSIPTQPSTGAGWGSGGGRLKAGLPMPVSFCCTVRLCRSAHPPDVFFGYFLVRTQESNTIISSQLCNKHQFPTQKREARRENPSGPENVQLHVIL